MAKVSEWVQVSAGSYTQAVVHARLLNRPLGFQTEAKALLGPLIRAKYHSLAYGV